MWIFHFSFKTETEEKELDEKVEPESSEEKSSDHLSLEPDSTEMSEKISQDDSTRLSSISIPFLYLSSCYLFLFLFLAYSSFNISLFQSFSFLISVLHLSYYSFLSETFLQGYFILFSIK